jgi:hypothetical protein
MKGIEMNKDQQIKMLKEEIATIKEEHEKSKERLLELYGKERSKREVERCIFFIQRRAAGYIIDSIIEGKTPDVNEFFKREANKVK